MLLKFIYFDNIYKINVKKIGIILKKSIINIELHMKNVENAFIIHDFFYVKALVRRKKTLFQYLETIIE